MKQSIDLISADVPSYVRRFISTWKGRKGYPNSTEVTIGECVELLLAVSYNFYRDHSDGRFFNNILVNEESIIAWDGDELIDILFFEVMKNLSMRVKSAQLFPEIPS